MRECHQDPWSMSLQASQSGVHLTHCGRRPLARKNVLEVLKRALSDGRILELHVFSSLPPQLWQETSKAEVRPPQTTHRSRRWVGRREIPSLIELIDKLGPCRRGGSCHGGVGLVVVCTGSTEIRGRVFVLFALHLDACACRKGCEWVIMRDWVKVTRYRGVLS